MEAPSTIKAIKARMIIDSRGTPTTEVELTTQLGVFRAACPSGASTGMHEALELRDKDPSAFRGKGVEQALENIRKIITPALIGMPVRDQRAIDEKLQELDGTAGKTFSILGANAVLPVSMACCLAAAREEHISLYQYLNRLANNSSSNTTGARDVRLPVPCMNIINGGKHAGNKLGPQEYMIAPTKAKNFMQAMQMGCEVYSKLKDILKEEFGLAATAVGDEGGFAPNVADPEVPLKYITKAIDACGYSGRMGICIDAAASEFYFKDENVYNLNFKDPENPNKVSGAELANIYLGWCKRYPIVSFEDPFDEEDHATFASFLAALKQEGLPTQVVGDDLTVSQVSHIQKAETYKSCNALLLKINQVGTITGAIDAANLAMSYGWSVMVSHRSGETEDVFIAHLAAALGCGQIKSGAPSRSERCAKYNELLRIEDSIKVPYGFDAWK